MAPFNNQLDEAIRATGKTLGEVAHDCRLSRTCLSKAVNGFTSHPHPRTVARLCAYFSRTATDLGLAGQEVQHG